MCERGGHSVCGACLSCTGAAAAASSCGRASPHPPRKILPRARAHTDCTSHAEGEEETTWYAQLRSLVDLKHANIVHALDLRASDAGEVVLVRQHGDGEREGESVCARTAASASGNSAASRTTSVNAGHARPLCPSTPPDPKLHRRAAAAAGPQPGPRPRWHHDNTRRHAQGAAAAARAGKAHLDLGPQGIFRWIVQHLAGRQRVQRPEQHGDASRRGRKRSYRVLFVIKTPSLADKNTFSRKRRQYERCSLLTNPGGGMKRGGASGSHASGGGAGSAGAAGAAATSGGAAGAAVRSGAFVTQEEAEQVKATRVETAATVLGETPQTRSPGGCAPLTRAWVWVCVRGGAAWMPELVELAKASDVKEMHMEGVDIGDPATLGKFDINFCGAIAKCRGVQVQPSAPPSFPLALSHSLWVVSAAGCQRRACAARNECAAALTRCLSPGSVLRIRH